jgi:TolB-like protein
MHSNMFREDCRPAALTLPVPARLSREWYSLWCVLSGLFHQAKLPQDASARLTGGLHFPYRQLILRARGLQRCPQKEWQLALSLRGVRIRHRPARAASRGGRRLHHTTSVRSARFNAVWNGRIVSDAALTTRLNAARTAIGDSGEEQRFIKTLPRKGFRFVGAVREAQEPAGAAVADNQVELQKPDLALPDKPSIAVLPFENMSGDPEQEYFADGMVEEIITALSRFKSLFVIARHSSFTFKGKAVDIKEVRRRLGVRYVLEGSVRKASGKVRITGQLIDAVTGVHLWADRFERDLTDISLSRTR